MVIIGDERMFDPACDCHLYNDRCCSRCGHSQSYYDKMDEQTTKAEEVIKEKIKFKSNGKVKKRNESLIIKNK